MNPQVTLPSLLLTRKEQPDVIAPPANGVVRSRRKGYVDSSYLQIAAKHVTRVKQASYEWMNIELGHYVLDVGCGPATDTIPLAALVGSTGKVVGIDLDTQMIETAKRLAGDEDVSDWAEHYQADAYSLPFETSTFDSCRSERLFQHLADPARALAEMVRITKSGRPVVLLDTDWATTSIDTTENDIERRIVRTLTQKLVNNAYSGRGLYRLFKQQSLRDIQLKVFPCIVREYSIARKLGRLDDAATEALTTGIVSPEELERFQDSLKEADSGGFFFSCVNMVLVAGTKP